MQSALAVLLVAAAAEAWLSHPPRHHGRATAAPAPATVLRESGNNAAGLSPDDPRARFGGIGRLLGSEALGRLVSGRVCLLGVGGVGSWTAEALVRSGVGSITLVDLDEICVSNVNRQVHATTSTAGQPKATTLQQRLLDINPHCKVEAVLDFISADNACELLESGFDVVIDAIDGADDKCAVVLECDRLGIPLVVVGGAGGKSDPTQVRTADLAHTTNDKLLLNVRRRLRREYGYPEGDKRKGNTSMPWDIRAVFSTEKAKSAETSEGLTGCDGSFGTSCAVTGTFGFVAADEAVKLLTTAPPPTTPPRKPWVRARTAAAW